MIQHHLRYKFKPYIMALLFIFGLSSILLHMLPNLFSSHMLFVFLMFGGACL